MPESDSRGGAVTRGVLRGRDHRKIGAIESLGGGDAALAISAGGARKTYAHVDPNEDTAGYVAGSRGVLLAVADAHSGCEASEVAIGVLLDRFGESWTEAAGMAPARWETEAREALVAIADAILLEVTDAGRRASRTTLVFALVRPGEDRILVASMGDSQAFVADPVGCRELTAGPNAIDAAYFLGCEHETRESLARKALVRVEPVGSARAVVLATDGLSEFAVGVTDPEAAVAEAVARGATAEPGAHALRTARELAAIACDAHRRNPSGDNVAVAVAWLQS